MIGKNVKRKFFPIKPGSRFLYGVHFGVPDGSFSTTDG